MNEFTIQEIRAVYQEKKVETYGDLKKFTSSFQVAHWLEKEIGSFTQEHLVAVYMNTKNEVISFSIVHIGTIDQSIAYPRDIFQRALLVNAARIIIAHNHPSGNTKPSEADKLFTKRIIRAGELIGVVFSFLFAQKNCKSGGGKRMKSEK
ncbi:DNA repair protein RadC [Enterococcus cecorum]|uniref:JAB domain-containing protein n=1 Tax=Enterococcus cecorum TaxID=44008 RepID=UPI0022DB9993|nr:JAB domain-containing protein [Enterococcus cecorum]CAI3366944.1 DNA repair protein RadC [Enterococcus cecorum]CAI3401303.1 DNA repair protein RadC [Enterococcus cecorum]CAI3470424.1 DNA repair protein RadC [Enterococcus cecorum]CAI3492790.1 DNA repair protein RadC [Enterococcus cecorum]CAI3493008.1 DNA repair protein RadC [Enterococcus cecorum]